MILINANTYLICLHKISHVQPCQSVHENKVDSCLERCLVRKFVKKFDCLHIRLKSMRKDEQDMKKPFCNYTYLAQTMEHPDGESEDPGLKFIQ